jgi:hypothetical protein
MSMVVWSTVVQMSGIASLTKTISLMALMAGKGSTYIDDFGNLTRDPPGDHRDGRAPDAALGLESWTYPHPKVGMPLALSMDITLMW